MDDISTRIAACRKELLATQGVLRAAAYNPAIAAITIEELRSFQELLDRTRHLLWLCTNGLADDLAAMPEGAGLTPFESDVQTEVAAEAPTASSTNYGFFEDVQTLVTDLFDRHAPASTPPVGDAGQCTSE